MIRIILKGKVTYGSNVGLKAENVDFEVEIKAPDIMTARTIYKTISYMLRNVNKIYKCVDYREQYDFTVECYLDNIKLNPQQCIV